MKISTKGRYGVRILLDLAMYEGNSPRLIRDISESQQISEKYISRLIIALRRANMVRSTRGAKGGYRFSRKPSELTLLDIVEVMEGPLAIVDGIHRSGTGNDQGATREIWERLNTEIRESMRRITLQDIIDSCRRMNAEAGSFDYCI